MPIYEPVGYCVFCEPAGLRDGLRVAATYMGLDSEGQAHFLCGEHRDVLHCPVELTETMVPVFEGDPSRD